MGELVTDVLYIGFIIFITTSSQQPLAVFVGVVVVKLLSYLIFEDKNY